MQKSCLQRRRWSPELKHEKEGVLGKAKGRMFRAERIHTERQRVKGTSGIFYRRHKRAGGLMATNHGEEGIGGIRWALRGP